MRNLIEPVDRILNGGIHYANTELRNDLSQVVAVLGLFRFSQHEQTATPANKVADGGDLHR